MVLLYVVYAPLHVQIVRKRHIFSCKIIYTAYKDAVYTLELNADTDIGTVGIVYNGFIKAYGVEGIKAQSEKCQN